METKEYCLVDNCGYPLRIGGRSPGNALRAARGFARKYVFDNILEIEGDKTYKVFFKKIPIPWPRDWGLKKARTSYQPV